MENSSLNHTENHKTEEKETKRTPIKQRKKENEVLRFIREHIRYFAAGALVVVLVIVLAMCAKPKGSDSDVVVNATESTQATEEAYQVDANENINALITQYYTAYAAGDVTTLSSIATPISANEQSYIGLFSQYVDEYQNIKCYTKTGLDENSYLVSVSMEIKFTGVDTTAPGLDFFYVRTNDDGSLYIDNLYSQYNLANQENALDTSIQNLIGQFESESDVMALQSEVQTRYDEALAADENLTNMIQTTIPAAIKDWVSQMAAQAVTEQTEAAEATEQPETEQPQETEQQEEIIQQTDTLATKDRVNVRAAADVESEKLGTLDQGTVVTRTAIAGDWSVIDYNGTAGYVKNEFLTYDLPDTTADSNSDSSADDSDSTNAASIAEGTVIMLQNTTNIRSGMSEDSSKVGTAYAGEKVTVVMSYAEGWTKVKWNGETGYIKTSLLQ
ncbi:SH3 domain-containing protein [Roseburia hominis]|uniref:SH3 domain-containing protein n=1 Tax=Roseburia hominis TaxID=301301 RepID=A0A395V8U4_9FIRM|nr:SH3 domain-containing protein [Roseburia hominis]RGS41813.1 SH3 domain-containing protein [Roseburia hominis]